MFERVADSTQKPSDAALAAAVRLQSEAHGAGEKPESYLSRGVDAVSSLVVSNDATRAEVDQYATGFLKAVGLFTRGRIGLAGSVAIYALDAMNPDTSLATQALDGTLGGAKGGLLKGVFHVLGQKELPIATKGALLGLASNAVETGLTRSTYVDPKTGEFDLAGGLGRVRDSSLNRSSIITNAVIFTAAHGLLGGADRLSGGLIKKSPLLANMTNGLSFGVVSGAGTELIRQQSAGEAVDIGAIAKRALIQGGLDSVAAIPGGIQSDAVFRKHAANTLSSAYYRARWNIDEGATEAKRQTYAVLNKLNLRHPLQTIGDLFYGTDVVTGLPKPKLTPDSNPIAAFERAWPQYVEKIQQMEEQLAEVDKRDHEKRRVIHDQMGDITTRFAVDLLTMWHGTAQQPGISAHSDAELATSNTGAQRVAQIRKALTLTAKSEYPNRSPLMQALTELLPESMKSDVGKNHEIAQELWKAKAKFFGYDPSELGTRMAMPGELYHRKRSYSTPKEWLPFDATDQLTNFFHGSISNSLPSIFVERQMLPAKELRLRGIDQSTGESAGQEFPRRAISITSDFDEAWAYTNHSPEYLTGFPIVIGVSRNVIPKAYPAGMLEPGELLVPKLKVGDSLLTKLGLRKPEATHIYAPDSQVAYIDALLARYRLKGVRVIGLNELQPPQWKLETGRRSQ